MSDATARLARRWAEEAKGFPDKEYSVETKAAIEQILATTTPTMADIEWNDAEHMFAGATMMFATGPTEVIMLSERDDASINFALLDGRVGDQFKEKLTPNGKRYGMHEIGGHPETLKDAEEYATAPVGTVVQLRNFVAISRGSGWSLDGLMGQAQHKDMAELGEGEVLKWGKR